MSEYRPELPRLKENFRRVVEAYCQFTGQKPSTALTQVCGSAQPRLILLDPEADMKAGKYDAWLRRFSHAWPAGLAWPDGVPRPPVEPAA